MLGLSFLLLVACSVWAAQPRANTRARPAPEGTIIGFSTLGSWQVIASDGVQAGMQRGSGADTLRLSYDFAGHGGYALLHRALPLNFPENFELTLQVRGSGAANDLQIKFVDASGKNVWWYPQRDFRPGTEWQTLRLKPRHIQFAWGPAPDHQLRQTASFEIGFAAGSGGGSGSIEIGALRLRALPPVPTSWPEPVLSAPAADIAQIDLGAAREFGGLTLQWDAQQRPSDYRLLFSDDGVNWTLQHTVTAARGSEDALPLPDAETRYVRVQSIRGPAIKLSGVHIEPLSFGASTNAYLTALAQRQPRGALPRGFLPEQSYWTLVGTPVGGSTALLSEDGQFEPLLGGPSLEPVLSVDGTLIDWSSVQNQASLEAEELPLPAVHWSGNGFRFDIDVYATGGTRPNYTVRYRYRNASSRSQRVVIAPLLRPFQVNPPAQFLNTTGGFAALRSLNWDGQTLRVNERWSLNPLQPPTSYRAARLATAFAPRDLLALTESGPALLEDEQGLASAALLYERTVPPGASVWLAFDIQRTANNSAARTPRRFDSTAAMLRALDAEYATVRQRWQRSLQGVSIDGPSPVQQLAHTLRTAHAHILMSRRGQALEPGTRSYRRSWIRDGAMMSAALLRLGDMTTAREYLDWYLPYVQNDGKVPCCVDRRGADPVVENDSSGELLFLAAELYRYTQDRAALRAQWPRLQQVVGYLEKLRQSERSAANLLPERRALYGLLPASISHEGYSAEPMHSYWDDFWALQGYEDAVRIAQWLDESALAQQWRANADQFRADLLASIRAGMQQHGIHYLPGAAELGDFDPTSSTLALWPVGLERELHEELLPTFERYWQESEQRRLGQRDWDAYTPYEWRNVNALLRLGYPERARTMVGFFMGDRRPAEWNQWAEVVGRDARQSRFIGDMPHGWVASDFIRSALDLFAYERGPDQALVLAAGVDPGWLAGKGVSLHGLHTPYGVLSYTLRHAGGDTLLQIEPGLAAPPGGLVLSLDGKEYALPAGATRISVDRGGTLKSASAP
ncbi:MAG: discoidin domain-containing protein [Steroidobacteraceae bacterium]